MENYFFFPETKIVNGLDVKHLESVSNFLIIFNEKVTNIEELKITD